ncbi:MULTISPECIES: O-methyltransferase [Paenibacillus]|uniref:O-methyltransferase n=2 Tax=Paenibacillus TaxID=44249 RepID=A0ABU6D3T8_9BACL|nr:MULTISPECIES: O-methyltransferase [Paenibacillus]MBA2940572.1 O-methyltransferase [Paenibacillus sp. CGMCC 1.16610]MCY9660818.1 O-methyltransferase [Paenibacillus anseongense]MEB4792384.1 O-methyltransferase [Paenibacillus chondroitinus]MVQ35749.1 O-methyltransferase [Paenibacillus anseongense]
MSLDQISLARQIDLVFRRIKDELSHVSSGTVFVHIRNNEIGKFGVKHLPFESKDGVLPEIKVKGLTEIQYQSFRQMALESLKRKKSWTHGEIYFDFTVRQGILSASITFETNYNMASMAKTI